MDSASPSLPRSRTIVMPQINQTHSISNRYTYPSNPNSPLTSRHTRRAAQAIDQSEYIQPVKPVYKLKCNHCSNPVCARGMKALLLSDAKIELYSTDAPSECVHVLETDYVTQSCHCRIRDVACLDCGNIIGYHVVSPCSTCLAACNNGHFWMFHSFACQIAPRYDCNEHLVVWKNLPNPETDIEFLLGSSIPYEQVCR